MTELVTCPRCGGLREAHVWRRGERGWRRVLEDCELCLGMGKVLEKEAKPERGLLWLSEDLRVPVSALFNEEGEVMTDKASTVAIVDMPITLKTLDALKGMPSIPWRYNTDTGVQDMMAVILKGREMGVAPMEALTSFYLVNGRVAMEGKLMTALILRAGHIIKVKATNTKATVTCFRWHKESQQLIELEPVEFSMEDAKKADLAGQDTYKKYPKTMLTWRAVSMAARLYYSDVTSGLAYLPEEVGIETESPEPEVLPDEIMDQGHDGVVVDAGFVDTVEGESDEGESE